MLPGMQLLLVEDDLDLVQAMARALGARGFAVMTCGDGHEALSLVRRQRFDLVLLDLSLPGLDGLHVLQRLRRSDDTTPVLILTARGAVGDRVAGLNAGADDYLAKPFDLDELEARIRAVVRRRQGEGDWRLGLLRLERASGALFVSEWPMDVPPREAAALRELLRHAGRAVPRDRLAEAVFAEPTQAEAGTTSAPPPATDALDVVMHRLRRRLTGTGVEVVTLRGVGYVLSPARAEIAP